MELSRFILGVVELGRDFYYRSSRKLRFKNTHFLARGQTAMEPNAGSPASPFAWCLFRHGLALIHGVRGPLETVT